MNENKWKQWGSIAIFAIFIIVIYKLLDNFGNVLSWLDGFLTILAPFLIGTLIAYILYFPCKSIENAINKTQNKFIKSKSRTISIAITYLIVALIILIIVNFVLPALSQSIIDLANNLPTYYNNIIKYVENEPEDSVLNIIGVKNIIKNLEQIDIKQFFSFENLMVYAKSAIGFISSIFSSFVTIIVSVYVLSERARILKFIEKVINATFSSKNAENIGKYFAKTNEIFYRFISSQIIDGIIVGAILSVAMLIMKVKYAVLLGFMIGLFNIIPYFGAIIAVAIALIITLLTGGLMQTIWVGIVIIILQQIDANIINPKIVGNSLTLSPLLVMLGVTVGGAYFGILGMFLAVPLITVLKIIINDLLEYKKR